TQRAPFLTSFYTFRGEEVTSHRLELFEFYSNPGSPGERADGEYPAVALMAWPGEMQYCSPEASIAVQHNTLQSVRAGSLRVLPRCGDATGAGSGALDLQFDLQSGDFGAVQGTVGGTPIDDPVVIPNHVTALDHSRRSWVAFTTLNGGLRAVIEGQGAHQKVLWAQYVDFGRPREVAQMCAGSGSTVELVRQSGAWMVRRVHLEHVAEPVLCSQQSVEPARVELFTKRPPAWEPLPALPE
ncbi:MAG: hypothetical protein KC492_27345, partial [Myxococcales bacterium]|nr:hypothetical protein [Myxococcales bacterium]